jgi:hypothetical protein
LAREEEEEPTDARASFQLNTKYQRGGEEREAGRIRKQTRPQDELSPDSKRKRYQYYQTAEEGVW